MSHGGPVENLGSRLARKRCDQIGPLPYDCHVLTEEDKQWIRERLEKVETTMLADFHKWASPVRRAMPQRFVRWTPRVEYLSDRLKNLEGR
jgi:hypothetical protein